MSIKKAAGIFTYFLALILLILFIGCSGSSSSGGTPDSTDTAESEEIPDNTDKTNGKEITLSGDYFHLYLGFDESDPSGEAELTVSGFKGNEATDHELYCSGGYLEDDETFTIKSYLQLDGSLMSLYSDGEDNETMRGAVIPGYACFAYLDLIPDEEEDGLGFDFFMKKSTGRTNTSLNGKYRTFGYMVAPGFASVGYGEWNFSGRGTLSVQQVFNSISGNVSSKPASRYEMEYAVADDGSLSVYSTPEGETLRGIVSADGNVIAFMDYSPGGNDAIGMFFAVRESSAVSLLSGEYIYLAFETDKSGASPCTYLNSIQFYGNGTFDDICLFESGNGHVGNTLTNMYRVDLSTSALNITSPDNRVLPGIISTDRTFFTFIVPGVNQDKVQLCIGMKKP